MRYASSCLGGENHPESNAIRQLIIIIKMEPCNVQAIEPFSCI